LTDNILLSSEPLESDIWRSKWALYRGSTAIIQAAVCGIHPVYLHQVGEIPIDSLYEVDKLHARVTEPSDFRDLLAEAETSTTRRKMKMLQDYCQRMFTPIDTRVFVGCIKGQR